MRKDHRDWNQNRSIATGVTLLLAILFAAVPHALAQSATPVAKLDPNRLIGSYYEIARYPIRREKQCVGKEMVLYALGDKSNTLQIVTTCQVKEDFTNYWNSDGKFSESADGRMKLSWIWPLKKRYWMLAIAPDYGWVLVGSPDHRGLWILSRSPSLPADVLDGIQAQATAQGFNTAKLVRIPQQPLLNLASGASQSIEP